MKWNIRLLPKIFLTYFKIGAQLFAKTTIITVRLKMCMFMAWDRYDITKVFLVAGENGEGKEMVEEEGRKVIDYPDMFSENMSNAIA